MTDPIDTARAEGVALGLAMAKAAPTYDRDFDSMERVDYGAWISVDDIPEPPIPPHVAAARVLLDDLRLAAALLDWSEAHQNRLRNIQGFGYGDDGLLFTVRDCWLTGEQVVWQRQSTPETRSADHAEMMRQIEIYRVSLALRAALEQIAKEGE